MNSSKQNNHYDKSLWAIYTTNGPISVEHLELSDIYILMRHDDNLKYRQNPVIQMLAYYKIDKPEDYYRFNNMYLVDNAIEKGELPKDLVRDFYIFKTKKEAQEELQLLRTKQDSYYEALPNEFKIQATKIDLGVIDLLPFYADFSYNDVLQDIAQSIETDRKVQTDD